MLNLKNVSLRVGSKLLFEDATFQLHAGQRLGLIGANGCGKTSLFRLLLGDLEPDLGEVLLDPRLEIAHVSQQSPAGRRSAVDFVLDGDRELREVQAGLAAAERERRTDEAHHLYERLETIDGFSAEARAGRLLHGLGFAPDDGARAVGEFSGGWRMRLNLAQALMCRSDLLLLDEPTNHLDLPAILWLERWLLRYPGMLIVVSHDRDFLDGVCSRIAHIEHQSMRLYTGNYSDFEALRSERLAQQQSLFSRQQKEIRHLQSYVDRFRYKASKARQAQSRLKMIERMTRIAPAHVDSPFRFHFLEPDRQPHHLVQLEQAVAGYDAPVLSGIDLLVSAGDRIGLLGVNGAGKSTLVKALADGSTLLDGRRSQGQHTRIGYFAQHSEEALPDDHTVLQVLNAAARAEAPAERILATAGAFLFHDDDLEKKVRVLSGGERNRLNRALTLKQGGNVILLDEPTAALDRAGRERVLGLLDELPPTTTLVVASHDTGFLAEAGCAVLDLAARCLEGGRPGPGGCPCPNGPRFPRGGCRRGTGRAGTGV